MKRSKKAEAPVSEAKEQAERELSIAQSAVETEREFNAQLAEEAVEVDPMDFLEESDAMKTQNSIDRDWENEADETAAIKADADRWTERFPAGAPIDTADTVLHKPTGEQWTVAYVRGEYLAWCGWPRGEAKVADCMLFEKATAEDRLKLLREMAAISEDDPRRSYAQRVLAEETITVTDCNAKSLPIELKEAIADAVRKMPPERVTEIVQEEAQKVVETLHAPHGIKADYVQNPLLPKGATVTPKRMATSGCGHGHANSVLCPQCRADRRP